MTRLTVGDTVKARRFIVGQDSNQLDYPDVYIATGDVGTVTGGPSPFVSRAGMFYKVRFPAGHIAVTLKDVKRVSV